MQDFRDVDHDFGELLDLVVPALSAEAVTQVREYYDNAEYELALEDLCFFIADERAPITSSAFGLIGSLARRLGIAAGTSEGLVNLVADH